MSDTKTTRVVLLLHGSSDPLWAKPFRALIDSLKDAHASDLVHLGFLEKSEPTLPTLVAEISELGPSHIKVLPVFLSAGKHLREDVPPLLADFEKKYQGLTFELLDPVGRQAAFLQMLENLVAKSLAG